MNHHLGFALKFKYKTIAILFIAAIAAFGPNAIAQQQHALHFVGAFKQAQDKRIEADKKMLNNMESAADWLVNFKMKYGHFPEPGVEQDNATAFLTKKLFKLSPYSMTGIMSQQEIKACPLRFVSDIGLIDCRREEWQKAPPSSWRAEPGTVTAILGDNYLLIWGAGADQLPIYDSKNNKFSLVWREFSN